MGHGRRGLSGRFGNGYGNFSIRQTSDNGDADLAGRIPPRRSICQPIGHHRTGLEGQVAGTKGMNDFTAMALHFYTDESGAHAIEHALLVAVVAVAGGEPLGEGLTTMLLKVNGALHKAITSGA